MLFIAILLPITLLVVLGYFVLLSSANAAGRVQTFGKYLSIWIFALAALVVIGIATAPVFGGRPYGMDMMRGGMHGMMMRDMMMKRSPDPAQRPAEPSAATPDADKPPSN